jgi:NADH-quinone oxidoreductase subunit A
VLGLLEGYLPFFVFAGLFLCVGLVMLFAQRLIGPHRGGKVKTEAYECGIEPIQADARERFSVPFYLVAILFILFDLETVFLFPWAVVFRDAPAGPAKTLLFLEVLAFVVVLGAGLFYVWKRRGLEWD